MTLIAVLLLSSPPLELVPKLPEQAQVHFWEGVRAVDADRFFVAVQAFRTALEIAPGFHEAALNLAAIHRRQGRFAEAGELYAHVLRHQPRNVDALAGRGLVLLWQKEHGLASWVLEKRGLEHGADANPVHATLAQLYVHKGEHSKAVAHLQRALQADPSDRLSRLVLGTLMLDYLNYEAAAAQFEVILKSHPSDVEALIGRATAAWGVGDSDAAFEMYGKALSHEPHRHALVLRRARLLEKKGDRAFVERALRLYDRYLAAVNPPADDPIRSHVEALKELSTWDD